MEPTIYKPSIYKGAGIYKNGADGGGGDYKVIGGRSYKTVIIGGVEWLAENLDFKFVSIGENGQPSTPSAWYYNNDESTYGIDGEKKCGLFYNWHAVKLLNDNRDALCPGWHVPTQNEYSDLFSSVGTNNGQKLKASNVSWASSWGGTDNFGFSVLPTGYRVSGNFYDLGSRSYLWTITETSSSQAKTTYFSTSLDAPFQISDKVGAFSLRLVKD